MKQYQREIDELGRVVIPKEVREALGFEPKKTVGITLLDDVIVINYVFTSTFPDFISAIEKVK